MAAAVSASALLLLLLLFFLLLLLLAGGAGAAAGAPAGAATAGSGRSGDDWDGGDARWNDGVGGSPARFGFHGRPFIRKTVFRRVRYLFVAGLEGTGHHMYLSMHMSCPSKRCTQPSRLTKDLWDMWRAGNAREAAVSTMRAARRHWAELVAREDLHKDPHLVLLNTDSTGTFSYPNFGGTFRLNGFADLRTMAKMAESVGADFRVLVSLRRARAVLFSVSVRRRIAPWPMEGVFLKIAGDALLAQLDALDPRFFACVSYEDVTTGGHDGAHDTYANLTGWEGGGSWLRQRARARHPRPMEPRPPAEWASLSMLQQTLDQTASVCGWTRWPGTNVSLGEWLPEETADRHPNAL